MSEKKGKHARVTQEELERVRSRFGKTWSPSKPLIHMNTQATRDTIRHYCEGIGDMNPLYTDPEYAKKTPYGALIAPPNWLYSVFPTWVLQGLPGIQAFHSGNDWRFYRPIYVYDTITP